MNQPEKLLQQYFGHASFRTGQKQAIDAILSGRDVLAVMPTGAGKSVCYQISALLLRGVTIVISPLISLMKDQVEALRQVGIPAAYVNSSITQEEFYHTVQMVTAGAVPDSVRCTGTADDGQLFPSDTAGAGEYDRR